MKSKLHWLSIIMLIIIIIQIYLIILTAGYAFLGEYEANKPSNYWSEIWERMLAPKLILADFFAVLLGVLGLFRVKKNIVQTILGALLIGFSAHSVFWLMMAMGAHY